MTATSAALQHFAFYQDVRYALLFLMDAAKSAPERITVKDVATRYHLSEKFLEATVRRLKQHGLLQSIRGRSGGYKIHKKIDMSVSSIFHALGRTQSSISCRLEDECQGGAQCIEKELEAIVVGKMNDELIKLQLPV